MRRMQTCYAAVHSNALAQCGYINKTHAPENVNYLPAAPFDGPHLMAKLGLIYRGWGQCRGDTVSFHLRETGDREQEQQAALIVPLLLSAQFCISGKCTDENKWRFQGVVALERAVTEHCDTLRASLQELPHPSCSDLQVLMYAAVSIPKMDSTSLISSLYLAFTGRTAYTRFTQR
ncbi:hypothetical protein WMY93_014413 [Mugilogobius chulae]|uniref:Uncharacterized protein n=1 Tax=Mugilogobius chulae TaxID=88201 RepID=A0AAW0NV94_9GOBI